MTNAVNEKRIICKLMHDRDPQPVLDRQVNEAWFFNSSHRDALKFILDHIAKYGHVPSKATFDSHMGSTYGLFAVSESLDYLLDAQAETCRWATMRTMAADVAELLDKRDTEAALTSMRVHLTKVESYQTTPSRIVDSMSDSRVADRWDDYLRREKGGALLGYSTGFPTIDATTLGLQNGHLVTVLAQPKAGKTTVTLCIANHVYSVHEKPVLFVSFEMAVRELEMRQEATMARINFKHLQSGELSKVERRRYQRYLDKVEDEYTWPFHFMDAASGSTVGAVRSQIERLEPAAVFLDGIYLMTDETTSEANTPTALTNITRGLKRLAAQSGIPVVINTQALAWKSKGHRITMDSAGYSSSFSQDSDVVLGIERMKDKDDDDAVFSRMLRVLASRNTGLAQVELLFDYDDGTVEEVA